MENLRLEAEQLRERNWLLQSQLDDLEREKHKRWERATRTLWAKSWPARVQLGKSGWNWFHGMRSVHPQSRGCSVSCFGVRSDEGVAFLSGRIGLHDVTYSVNLYIVVELLKWIWNLWKIWTKLSTSILRKGGWGGEATEKVQEGQQKKGGFPTSFFGFVTHGPGNAPAQEGALLRSIPLGLGISVQVVCL